LSKDNLAGGYSIVTTQNPKSPTEPNVVSRLTPVETAKLFRNQQHPTIIRYQNDWLAYDGSAYQMIEDDTIESHILLFLEAAQQLQAEKVEDPDNPGEWIIKFRRAAFNPKN